MYPTKVTFRLSNTEARTLYEKARARGISPHQEARKIVTTGLTLSEMEHHLQQAASDLSGLQQAQSITAETLRGLQTGLIDTLAVILASSTEGISQEDARGWVSERFQEQL